MFKGLSAFPLTPMINGEVDEKSFITLLDRLVDAGVDSIGALGSTGSYAYLTRQQRYRTTQLAVQTAAGIPVMTSIGAVRSEEVLKLAEDAQKAGVSAVLLAPVSYQRLNSEEVYDLYERIMRELSVPLCIYDNAITTGFQFTDELLIALSHLPGTGAIKLGALSPVPSEAAARITKLKDNLPEGVSLGISGDTQALHGLLAGCEGWYSVLGGLFPHFSLALAKTALSGDEEATLEHDAALSPLWDFFRRHGSLRTIATMAELMGTISSPSLPFPLRTISGEERKQVERMISDLNWID
ncbi:dihydrodipicolinate synthase family protein [Erwinia sp. BNK-24-b]|uniref:dihydrodipicolinate synthase family protein n=1 Tax=unclassified Erwinia TaxID=2622719 RepID=UPI0039BF8814